MVNTVGVPSKTAILGVMGGHCVNTNCPTHQNLSGSLLHAINENSTGNFRSWRIPAYADRSQTFPLSMSAMDIGFGEFKGCFMEVQSQPDKHFVWVSTAGIGLAFR
jgi:hypothetical protein